MKVSIQILERGEPILVQMRAQGSKGLIGDAVAHIGPEDKFFDLTYDQLAEMGSGVHEVE